MNKLVSTIITSYNSDEKFLIEAIKSVLNQTYNNIEIIIVDDGSTNGVCKKVSSSFKDKVKYIHQENQGLACARNTGILNSTGYYVCFLDDDDIWVSGKVERQVNKFNEIEKFDNNIGMTFTYSNVIDEEGKLLGKCGFKVKGNIYPKILRGNIIGAPSSVMIKKQVLNDVGVFNPDFRYAEDIELWYRVTKKFTVYSTNEFLINYRWRNNSLSKNLEKMDYYSEKALVSALDLEKGNTLVYDYRKQILSDYYRNMAYTYFSGNNAKMYKKTFYKLLKINLRSIFNKKLIFGYLISIFGESSLKTINRLRKREQRLPKQLTEIKEIV